MAKLDPLVSEFATTEEAEAHDAWVRAKVREAVADERPPVPHDMAVARIDAVLAKFETKT